MSGCAVESLFVKDLAQFVLEVTQELCHLQAFLRDSVLSVLPMNTKLNIADLNTKKLSKARREFLLYYCGSIEVEGDLTRAGQHEVEQHLGEEVHRDGMYHKG